MDDKFSILTSSYNSKKFLDLWASSILRQGHRPLEVVFIDDASESCDASLVEGYRKKFESNNIDLIIEKNDVNIGCASSYMKALGVASSDYLGVLDSDDILLPHAVEEVIKLYKSNPDIGWIYTKFHWCDSKLNNAKSGFSRLPPKKMSLLDAELSSYARHYYSHWRTFSCRVPNLKTVFKEGMRCSVDKYMGYRLEELAEGMFYNKVCYKYRGDRKGGVSRGKGAVKTWKDVREEAKQRRKKYNIKAYAIREHKSVS